MWMEERGKEGGREIRGGIQILKRNLRLEWQIRICTNSHMYVLYTVSIYIHTQGHDLRLI